jgi:2-dehydropantoate 2-reductase
MKILIVGAGSIGVYLGTMLRAYKHDVVLLGRKKLKKLNETILVGETPYELPTRIYHLPKKESYDYIFITSKLYDLKNNLQLILKNNLKTKYLISIQNGIVDKKLYEPYTKKSRFTSISVFEGFRLIENQLTASYSKIGWKTDNSLEGKAVSKLLFESGINCTSNSNLDSIKAEKTIMNCSVNILSAIERKTFFELCHNKTTLNRINMLFDEAYAVLNRLYAIKNKEILRKEFFDTVSSMRHYSSTYQDAVAKRKNEVEFLNGLIIKLSRQIKIPTPKNQKLLKEFYKKYPASK